MGTFTFVFPEDALQEDVFKRSTLPLLESVLQENKNALLLAYGASGSGKTHTVSGGRRSPGVLPMTINYLFQHLENSDDFAKVSFPKSEFPKFPPSKRPDRLVTLNLN